MLFKLESAYYQLPSSERDLSAYKRREKGLAPCASGKRVAGGQDGNKSFACERLADERRHHIGFFVIPEREIVLFKVFHKRMPRLS